jgi:AraC-like DNA-binding protein
MTMTNSPKKLIDNPETGSSGVASSDLLSDVLAQIRLTGEHVHSRSLAPRDHLEWETGTARICIVTHGALLIDAAADTRMTIDKGDLVMLPHGAGNLRLAASTSPAALVLCRFRFDPASLRNMVSALPSLILIRRAESAGWLDGIVHFLMIEAGDTQPGAALMISRLIDLLIIRTLRTWIQQGPASGWLGGMADVRIANALKAIHDRPLQRWTIDSLAAVANMSRSNFCERFTALVGQSPLRYHNEWRLALAREMLGRPDARIGEVGFSIGYESAAAFSRAYKAMFGHSPRAARA